MQINLNNSEKKIALLIDADNISVKYADCIFDELNKYGDIVIRRVYGDWTKQTIASWMDVCQKYAMKPVMQENNVSGKNASDICLVIDAMKLLFSNKANIFCIVSSDSDFTLLAKEIRENGIPVIGMGEEKTPSVFINACRKFVVLNSLFDENNTEEDDKKESKEKTNKESKKKSNITDLSIIQKTIIEIIVDKENKGKKTQLGEIGSTLSKKYPEFDVRNYGFSKLSSFVQSIDELEVEANSRQIYVTMKEKYDTLSDYIYDILNDEGKMNIGLLNKKLNILCKNTNSKIKSAGYTKLSTYLKHLDGVVFVDNNTISLKGR